MSELDDILRCVKCGTKFVEVQKGVYKKGCKCPPQNLRFNVGEAKSAKKRQETRKFVNGIYEALGDE